VHVVVVVEIQLQVDADKQWSWPLYMSAARARYRCPTIVLVISPSERVASWARTPIETDPHGSQLVPIGVSYANVPEIIDHEVARSSPELAVLSALAHHTLPIAEAALEAIRVLPEDRYQLYYDAILDALPELDRRKLEEAEMKTIEYKSQFGRWCVAQGEARGEVKGRKAGVRDAALQVARVKVPQLAASEEAGILAIDSEEQALELVTALAQAADDAQARAALTRALAPRA
jgi:hypothetical protein